MNMVNYEWKAGKTLADNIYQSVLKRYKHKLNITLITVGIFFALMLYAFIGFVAQYAMVEGGIIMLLSVPFPITSFVTIAITILMLAVPYTELKRIKAMEFEWCVDVVERKYRTRHSGHIVVNGYPYEPLSNYYMFNVGDECILIRQIKNGVPTYRISAFSIRECSDA